MASSIGSFLTPEQRAALDSALAEKEKENAQKAREHGHHKSCSADRKPRHSGKVHGGTGGPKKAGGGGRFTWGSIMTDGEKQPGAMDKNDPNYDSEEEKHNVLRSQHQKLKDEVTAYKDEVLSIVEEYFSSGDIGDVAESLEDLGMPGFMHYFVKRLVTLALDRNNREREMASVALSSLYANVIPPDQVQKGFGALVDSIGDLVLDVPDAPDLLAMFIARAVVDDVLPPAFALRVPGSPEAAAALKQKLEGHLGARHGAEKVLRCWGSGAGMTYQDTKDSIARLLDEFSASSDSEEASRCLRALNVPFFHHEAVKQALHRAIEAAAANATLAQSLVGLLARLVQSGEVSPAQLSKGLSRVSDNLEDTALDNPGAKEGYAAVMEMVKAAGLLDGDNAAARALPHTISSASITSTNANGSVVPGGAAPHSVAAFKAASAAAIREYFDSSDVGEVARRLGELDEPGMLHIFVKQAVVASLDRKDRERELVSQALAQLSPAVLSTDVVGAGFARLLAATDDLVLDCPDAVHLLSLFLGRAIVDEVLPPAYLAQVLKSVHADSLGVGVVKATGAMLSARHGAERLTNAWRGGAQGLDEVKAQIKGVLDEYVAGPRDVSEAARCLTELGVPGYHHQVVVSACELAFATPASEGDVVKLLGGLSAANVISATQMAKGLARVKASLSEEALDYGPAARAAYARIAEAGTKAGWATADLEA
mmetsp:Transcript_37781/g.95570  ORF Transcript_37781/g.95570 Transcript_37781/m.95570 type:complete len:712 (-) Transcript_37781:372-2507(-)